MNRPTLNAGVAVLTCPVCESVRNLTDVKTIEGVFVHFNLTCPCGKYTSHFNAGVRVDTIGKTTVTTKWTDEPREAAVLQDRRREAIEEARK